MNDINYKAPPVVRMEHICKRFPGVIANSDVCLELFKGEVLALLGENGAGKSTLMNMLIGLYKQDQGTIFIHGKEAVINSPQDSMALGVGMIHQEFMLVGNLTVAENVILGIKDLDFVPKMGIIKRKIQDISEKYGLAVNPDSLIEDLTVGEQQRVEILKLVYRGAEILILDEPTAVLTPGEARKLNEIIHKMLAEGKSAIFISHKMDEVLEFSDRVQILRRGVSQGVKFTKDIKNTGELAMLMVGRPVLFEFERKPYDPKDVKVKLENIVVSGALGARNILNGVSLEIREGEILGIAGVAGNGQQPLSEVITGLCCSTSGKLFLDGKDFTNKQPLAIIKEGVSHIPADRGKMGIVGDMSVEDNLSMKKYRTAQLSKGPLLKRGLFRSFANNLIKLFEIKTPTKDTEVKFLSGGNIQKTILAREIDSCKGILIAVYPSRGLDVGATQSVRESIISQRDKGCAVLLVSEELDELLMISDRIAVMHEGKIIGTVNTKGADIEEIGLMMTGIRR
ncbi:MAG: ABC transporter ATP-binding protein [Sphaerochaetaceae bacterium]|nr:ABC transporter ATP-binding protein [Sphaerochaetaceae bacterium]